MSTIVLWVSDINRQANFYSALLDAPITSESNEFCKVGNEKNSVLLHLLPEQYRTDGSALALAQEEVAIKPVFEVASIDEASYQDCIDPEGNVIQISEATSN
jgi:predicted enzyme related to lactoylglutathione lyase